MKHRQPAGLSIGSVFTLLYAGHSVGDHWIQRWEEVRDKGKPGRVGQAACARHVASLTATQALTLAAGAAATGQRLNLRKAALGLAVNAASHYWADRRTTLSKLARHKLVDKGGFYDLGDSAIAPCGTGAYALDQAWHHAWLLVSALIIASPTEGE